ncbi:hypothetical protein LY622_13700 [Halomonas sp. M5N1S17]|uniref:hypothetical protein n=1 Tax=Halomonas alkalisoli TaxID=2907158 RepID=UPI001F40E91D|nr:hypothetical protein [Halomonas alkalisoli]MCE9664488.1 hypothetical protein [Halomonas alkalisoli]
MNEQQRDRWANDLVTNTLGMAWHESDPQARKVADAAARYFEEANHDNTCLLGLTFDIRVAAGDPLGKMMQPELIAHVREMREVLLQIRTEMRRTNGCISTDTLARVQAVIIAAGGGA